MDIIGLIKQGFSALGQFFKWLVDPWRKQRKEQAEIEKEREKADEMVQHGQVDEINKEYKRLHRK